MKRLLFVLTLFCIPCLAYGAISAGGFGGVLASYHVSTAPNAPTSVSATPGNTQNTITWTASAVDGTHDAATSYNLLWGTSAGSEPNTITGVTSGYVHSSLTNNTTYYYKVRALNGVGQADSGEVNAMPQVANIITNGGFETGSLSSWTPYLASVSGGYFSASSVSADKNGGTYGLKVTIPTGASQQYYAVSQVLSSNLDSLSDMSFDYKIVSTECSVAGISSAGSNGEQIYLTVSAKDSGGTSVIDSTAYPNAAYIFLAFAPVVTGGGMLDLRPSTTFNTWGSFSHQNVKAWLTSHLKAGKTWADVATVTIGIEGDVNGSGKVGFRIDNLRTGP